MKKLFTMSLFLLVATAHASSMYCETEINWGNGFSEKSEGYLDLTVISADYFSSNGYVINLQYSTHGVDDFTKTIISHDLKGLVFESYGLSEGEISFKEKGRGISFKRSCI